MLANLRERIDLLERVADKLAIRGIEPASDVEKLRVFAAHLKDVEVKIGEFMCQLEAFAK